MTIDVVNGRRLAAIEPDLWNDEIVPSNDTLCRWADRRFAPALKTPDNRKWIRSKTGFWIPVTNW